MKKMVAGLLVVLFVLMSFAPAVSAAGERGGVLGFVFGCCFGIRSGAAYNDGKDLHWREWVLVVPIAGWTERSPMSEERPACCRIRCRFPSSG